MSISYYYDGITVDEAVNDLIAGRELELPKSWGQCKARRWGVKGCMPYRATLEQAAWEAICDGDELIDVQELAYALARGDEIAMERLRYELARSYAERWIEDMREQDRESIVAITTTVDSDRRADARAINKEAMSCAMHR